jgi:hypothetical protein
MIPTDRTAATAERITDLAHELLPGSERIAGLVVEPVLREAAEVSPRGAQVAVRSTEQNISATLAFGLDPAAFGPPPATLELVRDLHETRGDVNLILRAYRIGHRRFWELWAEHVGDRVHDREELQDVLSASSQNLFALFDSVVAGVEDYHRAEFEKPTDLDPQHRSAVDWYPLFPNPVVAESLLDRLINTSHQVFMNGPSYRPNKRPGRGTETTKEAIG